MSSRCRAKASSLGGATRSRHRAMCSSASASRRSRCRDTCGRSPASVISSKKSLKTSCRRLPRLKGSSHTAGSRSGSSGGRMRSTSRTKYANGHFASSWIRDAETGLPLRRGSSSGVPERIQPSYAVNASLSRACFRAVAVREPRVCRPNPTSRPLPARGPGGGGVGEPPLGVVEGRLRRRDESRGRRKGPEQVAVVGFPESRLRPVQLEEEGRRRRLAGLREVAQVEARVAGPHATPQPRDTGAQGARRLSRAFPQQREHRGRKLRVDPAALGVEQDRVFQVASRVPSFVQAD